MGRSEVLTKLPLDRWAKIMGIDPLHFNGVLDDTHTTQSCEQPWMQFAWQSNDRIGREDIAVAIAQAALAQTWAESTAPSTLAARLIGGM